MTAPTPQQTLTNKVAIVTGGAGDIGSVFCRALAQAGARVVLTDLNGDLAKAKAETLRGEGLECTGIALDVTSEDSANAAAAFAAEKYGSVDILVNAAALMKEIPTMEPLDLSLEWWNRVINVNLTGPLVCVRAVVPYMKKAGSGKIINITSGGAFQPSGVYGVTKLGLVSLTTSLATTLGADNINVNAIAPGHMDTSSGHEARHHNEALVKALDAVVP